MSYMKRTLEWIAEDLRIDGDDWYDADGNLNPRIKAEFERRGKLMSEGHHLPGCPCHECCRKISENPLAPLARMV